MADSKNTPGLQIADVLASATAFVWRSAYRGATDEVQAWQRMLQGHFGDENIWPDLSYADLSTPECFANTMVLHELIERSVKREDLYEGLPEVFLAAKTLHPRFLAETGLKRTRKPRRSTARHK